MAREQTNSFHPYINFYRGISGATKGPYQRNMTSDMNGENKRRGEERLRYVEKQDEDYKRKILKT